MSEKYIDNVGDSFPSTLSIYTGSIVIGMTRRQWLAGLAMQGLLASGEWHITEKGTMANQAYAHADAMIAHEKGEQK